MFKRTPVSTCAVLALGGALLSASAVQAQDVQRIEITGSAIRRIQAEGALPVQVISRQEIERSGATSVAELIQALPSMQGFTNEGASVGGGGNGFSGASLHNLGETRTLVLLNGRRLANFAGQTLTGALAGIDLNTIPIAAIERIEVLADGASALYGADAIGGVVNFITKKASTERELNVGFSAPDKGAREARVSASAGFGDLSKDGYNLLAAANFEKRTQLASVDREFAKTGVINFELNGRQVSFFNGSPRGIPANITHTGGFLASPYFAENGSCPAQHVALQEGPPGTPAACYYDYVTQLEILPERQRGSVLLQGNLKLGRDNTLFGEFMFSTTENTNRIAPPPGEIVVGPTSPFFSFVQRADPAATGDTVVPYRVADVGKRTQRDKTDAQHLALGVEGTFASWDYNTSFTYSRNEQASYLEGGYVELSKFFAALDSGLVNPFVLPGNQTPAAQQALADARILGFFEGGESKLTMLQARASKELMSLAGGGLGVAFGVSRLNEKFDKKASDIARGIGGTRFGDTAAIVPYGADRDAKAVFAEVVAPLFKGFELSGAIRHDNYSDFGSASTAKASMRLQPSKEFLLRGSIGTGFKAPTVPQVNATRQEFGVTSGNYNCQASGATSAALRQIATSLSASCPVGNVQYNVFAGGNKDLKPEKSKQWTLGLVFEPMGNVSLSADLWHVDIRDSIGQVDEATIFGDPLRWAQLFTTYRDPGTNQVLLAMLAGNANLGKQQERGLDLAAILRSSNGLGTLTTKLGLTYHLRNKYQLEKDGQFFSSIGQFGPDGNVVFRWQGRLVNTLTAGAFEHTLGLNFKAGYKDQAYTADDFAVFDPLTFEPFAYNGRVREYMTLDWQTRWNLNKAISFTVGVLNLGGEEPPRSLKSAGGGQQIGFDDRYYDPRGRTFYGNVSLKF